jgi:hypothetical protein
MLLSAISGHGIISDMDRSTATEQLRDYEKQISSLAFVKRLHWQAAPSKQYDACLSVDTPAGPFRYRVEVKRSYLSRGLISAIISTASRLKAGESGNLLLLARYVPRCTGERLAEAGVNFVDQVGNMNIQAGPNYHALVLGKPEPKRPPEGKAAGPATVRVLFALVAKPDAASWPARRLAQLAGVGKTAAAEIRERLVREGILQRARGGELHVGNVKELEDRCIAGYSQILRPKLLIGRFRGPERDPAKQLNQLATVFAKEGVRWAATGGPAAYDLQRFYRGEELPLFVSAGGPELQQSARILSDQNGPISLLRPVGELSFWRTDGNTPIAHPWLIYAELMNSSDPRALEAGEELRREYLQP